MPRSAPLPLFLCACAALLVALPGCSNTCDYGSNHQGGSSCKSRPGPNDEEKAGYHADSLTPRFKAMRRAEPTVEGVNVDRWGEIGAKLDNEWVWTANVDGKSIDKKGSLTASGEGTDAFDSADADPRALDRAMQAILRRQPDAEFVAGALALVHPRVEGGADITKQELRWRVTTAIGDDFYYYETDRKGRLRCVILST